MPYSGASASNLPPYIKKLSLKYRKAWVGAFNSAFHSFDPKKHKAANAEAYAFAVANSVVKKMKSKKKESLSFFPSGTKFVTAREVESYDSIITEFEDKQTTTESEDFSLKEFNIGDVVLTSLKEAKIDSDSGTAEIVAIQQGWSKNGRYYSKEVAESFAPLLLARPKIYLNHVDESVKKLGRNLHDWAATVIESYGKDGKTFAKIKFEKNPLTNWILESALSCPEQVQFSIDALAKAREGEVEGRSGMIIEKVFMLDSLDIVDYAAAGGKLITAYASQTASQLDILHEAAETLKDKLEKRTEKQKLDILFNVFIGMLYELSWSSDYDDDTERKDAINTLIDDFLTEFNNIDIVKAFESFLNEEVNMNLDELREKHPELIEQIKAEVLGSEDVKNKDTKISDLEKQLSEVNESLSKTKTDLEAITADKQKVQESLDKYEQENAKAERKTKIKGLMKDSNLGEFEALPEYFQKELLAKEKDEDIQEALKALSDISTTARTATVTGNGVSAPEGTVNPDGADIPLSKNTDEAVKILKGGSR